MSKRSCAALSVTPKWCIFGPLSNAAMEDDNRDAYKQMPIYRKGREIAELVEAILDLADKDNEHMQSVCGMMYVDAHNLSVKVAGAEAADLYDLRISIALVSVVYKMTFCK